MRTVYTLRDNYKLVVVHARLFYYYCTMLKNDGPFTQTTAAAWLSTVYIFAVGFSIFFSGSNPNVLVSNQRSREARTVCHFCSYHPTYASLYIFCLFEPKNKKRSRWPAMSRWHVRLNGYHTENIKDEKKKHSEKKYYHFSFFFWFNCFFSQSSIFINAIYYSEKMRDARHIRYMFIFFFLCPIWHNITATAGSLSLSSFSSYLMRII